VNAVATGSPVERLRNWYAELEPRERKVAAWGALGGAALLLLVVLLQLHAAVDRAERRLQQKRADVGYVQAVLPELRAAPVPQGGDQSLVVVVDRTTRDVGLAMNVRGTEPGGPNELRVRLEGAPFDASVNWILRLQREYGVRIAAASFERTASPGVVNASITLARP
jgi:type II secretory pathway component PulM